MEQSPVSKTINSSGIYFISETAQPEPAWETFNFKYSGLRFPFFTFEPPVLLLQAQSAYFQTAIQLLKEVQTLKLQTQVVLFDCNLSVPQLLEIFNTHKPFKILQSKNNKELENTLHAALETAHKLKQDKVLFQLFNEQNKELQKVSKSLEEKIEKRQNHLQETREKLSVTNQKTAFLQQCLVTIHNSTDIKDLEQKVTEMLANSLELSWFRIVFAPAWANNVTQQNPTLNLYQFPLVEGTSEYGSLVFARPEEHPFKRDERDFLDQICESISLCIDRMLQIERNHDLRSQWQSTFNAISDPVCLIDQDYNLRITNKNFAALHPSQTVEGKKCYEVLFGRKEPCTDCRRGSPFRLRDQKESAKIYEVFSQAMTVDYQRHYFHVYRDVSRQLGFERQLMESAKLAELGTISSSIAHELNNPLGGMLNFIQLIKMDLKGDESFYNDIVEMENGANKCKNIVQNLLGFSRDSHLSEVREIDLEDVLRRSIMITELRTRALGIPIRLQLPENKISVRARFNQMAQVFCNVLQNSYESLLEKRKKNSGFTGAISIAVSAKDQTLFIEIQDDGIGLDPSTKEHIFDPLFTTKDPNKHSGLGLTLAAQILKEHNAVITVSSQKDGKTCASIRFPNPVLSE